MLLTFFICLHNQLSAIYPNVTYQRVQTFEKDDSSNREKMNGGSFQQLLPQNLSLILL